MASELKPLPKGPHKLTPEEVHRHQRVRIYQAVMKTALDGTWNTTSVKILVDLAKVSRRTFYEQFWGKDDCFVAVCCLIAMRWRDQISLACRSAQDPRSGLAAALEMLAKDMREKPELAKLAIVDAQSLGLISEPAIHAISIEIEHTIAAALRLMQHPEHRSGLVAKGIIGGLHRVLYTGMRNSTPDRYADILDAKVKEMADWAMLYRSPAFDSLGTHTEREAQSDSQLDARGAELFLMDRVFHAVSDGSYHGLTDRRLAEVAEVTQRPVSGNDRLLSKEDYFLAAFDELAVQLTDLVEASLGSRTGDPEAVHQAIGALESYFTEKPLCAKILVKGAFTVGPAATEDNLKLSRELISTLVRGVATPDDLTLDALAGAFWHIIGYWVNCTDQDAPQTLTDELAYIVLTPFIGAAEAIRLTRRVR